MAFIFSLLYLKNAKNTKIVIIYMLKLHYQLFDILSGLEKSCPRRAIQQAEKLCDNFHSPDRKDKSVNFARLTQEKPETQFVPRCLFSKTRIYPQNWFFLGKSYFDL